MAIDQVISFLRTEQTRLDAELAALPAAAWTRSSPCAGWTLATVVAHLAVQGRIFGGVIRLAREGRIEPPPPLTAMTRAEYYAQRDALIAQMASRSPAEILDAFHESGDDFVTLVESLTAEDLARPAYNWGPGTRPVETILGLRLFELAIHHWDIRRSIGDAARVPDDLDPFLVEHLATALPGFYKGGDAPEPVRVELVSAMPITWWLSAPAGVLQVADIADLSEVATIRTDPQTLALAATGRLRAGETVPGGTWTVAGDVVAANRLLAGFTGY